MFLLVLKIIFIHDHDIHDVMFYTETPKIAWAFATSFELKEIPVFLGASL